MEHVKYINAAESPSPWAADSILTFPHPWRELGSWNGTNYVATWSLYIPDYLGESQAYGDTETSISSIWLCPDRQPLIPLQLQSTIDYQMFNVKPED